MTEDTYFKTGGLNLFINPLANADGQLVRAVNVDSFPFGAKTKRLGYTTYLGTADNSPITRLFSWTKDNGTLFNYRQSGGTLYYSTQGTGAWTICGNGTLTAGSAVDYAVLNNTLLISQGGGTTRTTTSGTSFSDASGAPAGPAVEQYLNRIFISGTSSVMTYSVTNDPTNWQTTGTSDSSSLVVPGPGLPNKLFKLNNRLNISKTLGGMYYWDNYSLVDRSTDLGPSSAMSYAKIEDSGIWANRLGVFSSFGDQPNLISNPIQRQFYNDAGSGIQGATFGTMPAIANRYDYLLACGTVTDDFTNETIPNALIKYDYQKNEFLNWTFANFPTAFGTFVDNTGQRQMIFGDTNGQCYQFGGANLNDNGAPVESILEFIVTLGNPHLDKDWRILWMFFNPGCEAQIQVSLQDTFVKGKMQWVNLGDALSGVVQYRFIQDYPNGSRAKILYVKIIESSRNSRFSYYGMAFDASVVDPG